MAFAANSCLLPCKAFAAIALSSFVYDLSERLDFKKDFCWNCLSRFHIAFAVFASNSLCCEQLSFILWSFRSDCYFWAITVLGRLRVFPQFSSGIVGRAKRDRAWKSPHAGKGDRRRGERKMRDYRQSPSFWTNALLSQRKTLIGSSMEICQHLSKTPQPLSTLDIITICRTNK